MEPVAESRYIRPTFVHCHLDIQVDRGFTKTFLLSSRRIALSDGNVTRRLDDTEGVELTKTEGFSLICIATFQKEFYEDF